MKVIIVGGVAGGASCAARLRRLDEKAEILMVERGPYVSYANCGLPYHIWGVIEKESSLLVANEQMFRGMFAHRCADELRGDRHRPEEQDRGPAQCADRRGHHRVLRQAGAVARCDRRCIRPCPASICPGSSRSAPCRTRGRSASGSRSGTDFLAGMYSYSGIQFVKPTRRAVVIGGGFIGLETAENLIHAGFEVTLIEMLDQVLAPLDPEFARLVEGHMKKTWRPPGRSMTAWPDSSNWRAARSKSRPSPARLIPPTSSSSRWACGRTPRWPKSAGLAIGERGGIRVDDADAHQRPGHLRRRRCHRGQGFRDRPVEPHCARRAGEPAGPHRGRRDLPGAIPAIAARRAPRSSGCSVAPPPGPALARRLLKRLGDADYEKIYLFPNSHAGYYPGARCSR